MNEAFANDTIDAALYGDLPAIVGKAGRLDTVWLAGNDIDTPAWLNTSFLDKALKEQEVENFWPVLDKDGAVVPTVR